MYVCMTEKRSRLLRLWVTALCVRERDRRATASGLLTSSLYDLCSTVSITHGLIKAQEPRLLPWLWLNCFRRLSSPETLETVMP